MAIKKLNLSELNVQSFITEKKENGALKGGVRTLWYMNGCTGSAHELCIPRTEWRC